VIDQIGTNIIVNWINTNDYYTLGQTLREYGYEGNVNEVVFFNSEILAVR
jgi:hypothetical protein